MQEDVDAVGLSILSGSHVELVEQTLASLADQDGGDIKVFIGGTIPAEDHDLLRRAGVAGIFTAEQTLDAIVALLAEALST